MVQAKTDPNIDVPAIGISVQHAIDQERQLVFQCHVGSDQKDAAVDKLVDRLFRASNRQAAVVKLPAAKKQAERLKVMQKRLAEDMVRLDAEAREAEASVMRDFRASGRKGELKMNAQQQAHKNKNEADRGNAATTMERLAEDIKAAEETVAEYEAAIKGA
jgi:hypothetical protein